MIKIGITGGVGCGKSSVLAYLREHTQCRIVLADEAGHLVKEKGTQCYDQLVKLLGKDILMEDGGIDRAKMAALVFAHDHLLKQVNAIIHPAVKTYIRQEMDREEAAGEAEVFFLEAALLIEAGYLPWLDELWYVYSEETVRKQRLKQGRNYTEEKCEQIMAKQLADKEFRRYAQVVIDNSADFEQTKVLLAQEAKRLRIWKE